MIGSQPNLFSGSIDPSSGCEWGSPAAEWAEGSAKHALDDLFDATFAYRSSREYYELVQFVKKFRFYSPYNALLIHIQRPGATFVAPAFRWKKRYGYNVRPNANPLVILQPMGPVMFVFDVADVEAGRDAKPLPPEVLKPFEPVKGEVGSELGRTIENAKRDGIRIQEDRIAFIDPRRGNSSRPTGSFRYPSATLSYPGTASKKERKERKMVLTTPSTSLFYRPDAELLAIKYEIDTETVLNLLLEEDPPFDAEWLINWEDRIGRNIGKRIEAYSQKYGIPKQMIASMLIDYRAIRRD